MRQNLRHLDKERKSVSVRGSSVLPCSSCFNSPVISDKNSFKSTYMTLGVSVLEVEFHSLSEAWYLYYI